MSAFAKKKKIESALLAKEKLLVLLYKDVYFTNKFHPSFPCEVDSLLQEVTDVFPDEVPHGLPPLRGIEHQIDLILGCPIPNRPIYRTNPKEIKEIQKQVKELQQKDFVRESLSPSSVPVILVLKKEGTWRMCFDSRAINKITVKYKYPIPRLNDMLDELFGYCVFSKIDLKSGYNQIHMKESDDSGVGIGVVLIQESKLIAYFSEKLKMFPYVIKYKKGKENTMVDALSRRYALLTSLQTKLLGFEIINDLYVNDSDFHHVWNYCIKHAFGDYY
ncbi:hypothetical protein CR513_47597, partial [Mucuna pruriens]